MSIETKPRRQRLPYPESHNGHGDHTVVVAERPTMPELPPVTSAFCPASGRARRSAFTSSVMSASQIGATPRSRPT